MSCITKEQWKEVYNKEIGRLRGLAAEGYDIEEALDALESMNNKMEKGSAKSAAKVASEYGKQNVQLTDSQISSINKNKPRLANGTPLRVVSGYTTSNGEMMYQVKYPNSDKLYLMSEGRVWYDQIAPREQVFGSEPFVKDVHTAAFEKLEYEVWNDQSNALKLFDTLAELDNEQNEHTVYLRGLLEQITDPTKEILNAFKVYLNKEADSNHGIAVPYGSNPRIELNIMEGSNITNGMSAAEVYVHEMLHMSTEVAMLVEKGELANVTAEMRKLFDKAGREIKPEEFPEVYDYIFGDREHGMSEFVAYAMTNAKFKERLSQIEVGKTEHKVDTRTVWGKLANLVIQMYEAIKDMVSKRDPKEKMDERIGMLVTQMWMHNNNTTKKARGLSRIGQYLDDTTAVVDKAIIDSVKKGASVAATATQMIKDRAPEAVRKAVGAAEIGVAIVNPWAAKETRDAWNSVLTQYSDALSKNPLTRPLGELLAPEGSLRMTTEYIKEDDDEVTRVEKFGLMVQKMDQHREHVIEGVGKEILSKFGKISHKDQTVLTKTLLETDAKVLMKDYSMEQIAEMLTSESTLDKEIADVEAKIDGFKIALGAEAGVGAANNYYKIQAKLLGQYMTTGKGYSGLNMNAQSIVEMKSTHLAYAVEQSAVVQKNKVELVELVDKLATMYGMRNANANAKSRTAQIIAEKKEAVENMLAYHVMYDTAQYGYRTTVQSQEEYVKGELKDLKASYAEVRLAGNSEVIRKEMKRQGFTYVGPAHVQGMGVYKKWTSGLNGFDKQAVAKINEFKEMHTVVSVYNTGSKDFQVTTEQAKEEVRRLFKKRRKEFVDMLKGIEPEADGYVPIVSHKTGEINNFGLTVDSEMYEGMTDQDKKAPIVLAKMMGEIGEKLQAKRHNSEVLMYIHKDMLKNYKRGETSKNQKEYIEIGPDAQNNGNIAKEFADRVWKDMPQNIKEKIMEQGKGDQYIAVRRDMVYMYFGMRSPSILNSKLFFMDETIEQKLNKNNLGFVVEGIKLAGDVWQEIVALNALNIVVKTPMVIITNLISNAVYSFYLGQLDPLTGMTKAFRDTKEYMDLEKEKIGLRVKRAKGTITVEERRRLNRVEVLQRENPVHDLMEAGLFTSVASDTALVDLKSQTRLQKYAEKITDKIPEIVKDVGSVLYVTEGTGLYNALLMATAYGDFVSRVNRYQFLQKKGVAKGNALKMVTDEFVNYNRLSGPVWKWMKEMGFAQFMQYFFGAVKSMAAKLKDKPTAMVMMNMLMDAPNPSEAMPWNADLSYKFHDPFDILFNQAPEFIMTPATLRATGLI